MITTTKQTKKSRLQAERRRTGAIGGLGFLAGCVVSAVLILVMFASVTEIKTAVRSYAQSKGYAFFSGSLGLGAAAALISKIPGRVVSNPELPTLIFDVDFKSMEALYAKRAQALESGILVQGGDDFVKAAVRVGEKTVPVKIRLKGDVIDHLETNKWSLRVNVSGDHEIFGMRRFSIQHPVTRAYQAEPIFLTWLHDMGVLAPRYFFVKVQMNGADIGIMAVEEHFSKEILESNERRNSVIIRFDESLLWDDPRIWSGPFNDFRNARIDAFESSSVSKDPILSRDFLMAAGLLRGFVQGALSADKVFDAETTGKFLAAVEIWGATHALRWHNMRFYYNPVVGKLEIIAYDASLAEGFSTSSRIGVPLMPLGRELLNNSAIRAVYLEKVRGLAGEVLEANVLQQFSTRQQEYLDELRTEFFLLEEYPLQNLKVRAGKIVEMSDEELLSGDAYESTYPALVYAELDRTTPNTRLVLRNAVHEQVEVTDVVVSDLENGGSMSLLDGGIVAGELPLRLAARSFGEVPELYYVDIVKGPDLAGKILRVEARGTQNGAYGNALAQRYVAPLSQGILPSENIDTLLENNGFLRVEGDTVVVPPGDWRVAGDMVIPPGYKLEVKPGASMEFAQEAALISYGPIQIQGTGIAPVRLTGHISEADSFGAWQGVAVIEAGFPSSWQHVDIHGTTGVSKKDWSLVGGVSFYKSEINCDHCEFSSTRAEDALNVIHTNFSIDNSSFHDLASDALDSDFSTGIVSNSIFASVGGRGGGDAIDVSGSRVSIESVQFRNIFDKAVSVGEGSSADIKNATIDGVGTGVASKDGSNTTISGSKIWNCKVAGLFAYIKKAEYGAASIIADTLDFKRNEKNVVVQTGSSIVLDGAPQDAQDLDVDRLYKTVMKKGRD